MSEKSPFSEIRTRSSSRALAITSGSGARTGRASRRFNMSCPARRRVWLIRREHIGRKRSGGSCRKRFKIGQVTGVVETSSHIAGGEVRKFTEDGSCVSSGGEITKDELNRDAGSFDARLASKYLRVADN